MRERIAIHVADAVGAAAQEDTLRHDEQVAGERIREQGLRVVRRVRILHLEGDGARQIDLRAGRGRQARFGHAVDRDERARGGIVAMSAK